MGQRSTLALAAVVAMLGLAHAAPSPAQEFPTRPVHIIVPNPPGGATDVLARVISEQLGTRLGQPVVVENRPGASGTVGSDLVAKARPDGHLMVMGHAASHATSPSMYRNLPYDPVTSFAPVTLVANVTNVIIVNPSVPAKSVKELIGVAKASPGKLVFGSGGTGAITHLAGELFKQLAGVELRHVPYKGSSQAMTDLLGGHISLMFENLPGAIGHIRSGKVRPLAVLSHKRSSAVPDLPTVAEAGLPGAEAVSWFGLLTTAGTPKEVVDKLNREIVAVIRKPEVQARMADVGAEAVGSSPEEFGKLIRSERDKWGKVIKASNIQPAS
jgi:tripartite-type tricarboxylate transporter receptor subunit TctC